MPYACADLYLPDSWQLALRAQGKARATQEGYGTAVRQFTAWAEDEGREPTADRPTVAAFIASLLDRGAEPSTARARQLGLRMFSAGSPTRARATLTRCWDSSR